MGAERGTMGGILFWGQSSGFWDTGLILSVCFGGVVAVALAITTIGSTNAHKLEAAEANRQAISESLARAKIEERIAPRRVTEEQARGLAQSLRPFSGQRIVIESYALDVEGQVFAEQISDSLGNIFSVDNWVGLGDADGGFVKGVNITGSDKKLVAAMADAFRGAGLTNISTDPLPKPAKSVLLLEESREKDPTARATVTVGVKPIAAAP